jgi:hypothetical protein
MARITLDVCDRHTRNISDSSKAFLIRELRELGALCLDPLPDYQIFSTSCDLDDKIIIMARRQRSDDAPAELVGFVSAVMFPPIPGVHDPVFHTGLTVVVPSMRRSGIPELLFGKLVQHVLESYPSRVWFSSLSGVPSSLVRMATLLQGTFPSPGIQQPCETQIKIAREIDRKHRDKMLISTTAIWEEKTFVFRGCNAGETGKCFRKALDDKQYYSHRDQVASRFYSNLLRNGEGDAVLQVGWITADGLAALVCHSGLTI